MNQVKITRVTSDFIGKDEFLPSVATVTVYLDNNEVYQLRVVPDSNKNVYVWVDRRERFGKWKKLVEILNGEQRRI